MIYISRLKIKILSSAEVNYLGRKILVTKRGIKTTSKYYILSIRYFSRLPEPWISQG